jgi:hypothetical protein
MTRTIEMQTKFDGDWSYEIRFEENKIWIDTGCKTVSICFDDFDRIIAEYERFKKLHADANREEAA